MTAKEICKILVASLAAAAAVALLGTGWLFFVISNTFGWDFYGVSTVALCVALAAYFGHTSATILWSLSDGE
jgi:hypothetical protein